MKSRAPLLVLGVLIAIALYVRFGERLRPVSGSAVVRTESLYPLEEGRTWEFIEHSSSFGDSTRKYVASKKGDAWIIDEAGRGMLNAMPMSYQISDKGIETHSGFMGAQKTKFSPAFLELPKFIELGRPWTWRGVLSGGPSAKIDSVYEREESITVPAGTFTAAKIVRRVKSDLTYIHWYAKEVGPVKVVSERPMFSSSMELVSYSNTAALVH